MADIYKRSVQKDKVSVIVSKHITPLFVNELNSLNVATKFKDNILLLHSDNYYYYEIVFLLS